MDSPALSNVATLRERARRDIAQGAIQFFVTTANGTSMDTDTRLSRLMRRMMGMGAKLSNEAMKLIRKGAERE